MRLPNFFLVCIVRPAGWRLPLVLPLPIFLVDEIIEAGEVLLWLLSLKFGGRRRWGKFLFNLQPFLRGGLPKVREAWRKVRRSGSYVLFEAEQKSGLKVTIKFI